MDAAKRVVALRAEVEDLRRRLAETEAALDEACGAVGGTVPGGATPSAAGEAGRQPEQFEELVRRRTAELAESERLYRELVQNARSAIVRWNTAGRIEFVNEYLEELFGYEPGELLGKPLTAIIVPVLESGMTAEEFVRAIVDDPWAYEKHDNENVTKSGGRLWMAWTNRVITDERGQVTGVFAIGTDRTAQRAAEQELYAHHERLRRLAAALASTERHERRKLAVWLHEDIAQALASARLMLGGTRRRSPAAEQDEGLRAVDGLLREALRKARDMGMALDPPSVLALGLAGALEWAADQAQRRYGFAAGVTVQGQVQSLDQDVEMVLFEAVNELLTNAGRHAAAARVSVTLTYGGEALDLTVADDGKGLDPSLLQAHGGGGLGLLNVQEHLAGIGGSVTVTSAPDRGSTFVLHVPAG